MRTIGKQEYLNVGQFFQWAYQYHYNLWFTGSVARHRRTEIMLPRLVRYGKLVDEQWGKKKVYAVPRMKNTPIAHGLGVTDTIVRLHHSLTGAEIIPERYFKGFGSVPDWGLKYEDKLLLVEFSTQNNFEGAGIIKTKMTNYMQNLPRIEEHFNREGIVLFVIDVKRERVQNFIDRNPHEEPYYFVDFESFKNVTFGQQLKPQIYILGDGKEYSL